MNSLSYRNFSSDSVKQFRFNFSFKAPIHLRFAFSPLLLSRCLFSLEFSVANYWPEEGSKVFGIQ